MHLVITGATAGFGLFAAERLVAEAAHADRHGDYLSVRGSELKNLPPSELARDDAACAAL